MNYRGHLLTAVVVSCSLLQGCAITYRDDQGYINQIGFLHQRMRVDGELVYIEKKAAGLSVELSKTGGEVNLGVKRSNRVFAMDDGAMSVVADGGVRSIELSRVPE